LRDWLRQGQPYVRRDIDPFTGLFRVS